MSDDTIRERSFFASRQISIFFSVFGVAMMGAGAVFLTQRSDTLGLAYGIGSVIVGTLAAGWAVSLVWLPVLKIDAERLWYRDHWMRLRELGLDRVDASLSAGDRVLGEGLVLKAPDLRMGVRLPLDWFTQRDRAELLEALGVTVVPQCEEPGIDTLHRVAVLGLYLPPLGPVAWMMSTAALRKARRSGRASDRVRNARWLGMIGTAELVLLIVGVLVALYW